MPNAALISRKKSVVSPLAFCGSSGAMRGIFSYLVSSCGASLNQVQRPQKDLEIPDGGLQWCRLLPEARQHDPALQRDDRSEEHTSELQSRLHLVCRLLL